MDDKRQIIAQNISSLRRSLGITQAELAEKISYSDKAVSKWERGDSIPDVLILAELAEMFSVTVDYFLSPHSEDEKKPVINKEKKKLQAAISLTVCIFPCFVATVLYVIFSLSFPDANWLWKTFVTPLPAVFLLSLIFSSVWWKKKMAIFGSISALIWSVILVVYVFIMSMPSATMMFILGIPLQMVVLLWYFLVNKK